MAIQQLMLGVGASKKTYRDDVFNTYLYKGTNGANTLNTGLNMSGEGGLTWIKSRSSGSTDHTLFDTVRGVNKKLRTDSSEAESTLSANQTFTSTGFTLNNTFSDINDHNVTYTSWNFLKAKGFFDIVTYTGNSSTNQTISHSLGSIPGCIMIKSTSHTGKWTVYHRGAGQNKYLYLDEADAASSSGSPDWSNISSTSFEALGATSSNENGYEYIAYVFAGGESTATDAHSIDFDGSNDYLSMNDSADFNLGTSSFTIEGWVNPDVGTVTNGYYGMICGQTSPNWYVTIRGDGPDHMQYYDGTSAYNSAPNSIPEGQWTHFAFVNNGGTGTWYINGMPSTDGGSVSAPNIPNSSGDFQVGRNNNANYFNGKLSNLRIVKGTAVYTSAFRPPTAPLTNITNTKLLCCNKSTAAGHTISPDGNVVAYGMGLNPAASTDSPFDDPDGFVFGEGGDQNVIKTGTYIGNGSSTGPEINLGWEPDFILLKNTENGSEHWKMFDSMRGIPTGGNDTLLEPSTGNQENSGNNALDLTPTGFKIKLAGDFCNEGGKKIIYMCIRRPDGYCGKPAEVGTSVFNMDAGNSSTTQGFTSGFPVDFALSKKTSATSNWEATARLIQEKYLLTNSTNAEGTFDKLTFDDNTGWNTHNAYDSVWQSFMFKRHAGFDLVAYTGNGANRYISHNLNKIPEMVWFKRRDSAYNWGVYHKGLNGGTNPHDYYLQLNTAVTEQNDPYVLREAPTSTHFKVGNSQYTNVNNGTYIVMLFASTAVSKVGYYAGNGSTQTISLGFQPRFAIVKPLISGYDWYVVDTTRGWGSGNDNYMFLNGQNVQAPSSFGEPTSTGWLLDGNATHLNASGQNYIYYAHA